MRLSHSTQAQSTASHCQLTSPTGEWLFPLYFPSLASPYAITFQLDSTINIISSHNPTAPSEPRPPHYRGFTIILRHTTVGRTPVDEWSVRRRDLYLTTHNTHNRQTSMIPAGFEPAILESEQLQNHALDHVATGTSFSLTVSYVIYVICDMCHVICVICDMCRMWYVSYDVSYVICVICDCHVICAIRDMCRMWCVICVMWYVSYVVCVICDMSCDMWYVSYLMSYVMCAMWCHMW
jgi:hypothetical protein